MLGDTQPADETPDDTAKRVVRLGFLREQNAQEALEQFNRAERDINFGSFLLEQGLIGLEQLEAVQGERVGDSTVIGQAPSKVGEVFAGCRVEKKVGRGAMGSVYLAIRENGEQVVIKFLDPMISLRGNSRARFLRTGELVQDLAHPNVARVYEVFDDPRAVPYQIMELVDGEPLGDRLERDGRLAVGEALDLTEQVAQGLAAAHALGIVHRDVKPDNVIITPDGVAKVIDFGLAKNTRQDEGLSHAGQVLGTPYYMAPEQWGEHAIDHRADVFSLGSMLYHLLLGEVPFKGERPLDVAHKIVNGDCTRPRELREELSQDVEWVLLRMLDPDRQFRYDGMPALLRDLARLRNGQPPKIPCLEPLDATPGLTQFPLLPGKLWTIGRQSASDLALRHGTISRKHAEIHRLPSGYAVRDEASSYGTFLGERRVREAVLTDGAEIRFGELRFVFRSGQRRAAGNAGRGGATALVPEAFLEVLATEGDARTVLTLIERLEPQTHDGRVTRAREVLGEVLDDTLGRQAAGGLDALLRRSKAVAVDCLETITNRDRSEDASAWLTWWGDQWSAYPSQLGPILPRRQDLELVLLDGETPEQSRFPLIDWLAFTVGRDEHSAIRLTDLSVSRLHATIQRLDQRYAIRDEGSRSGTVLNGNRVQIAFLRVGDRLTLGTVQLEVAERIASPAPEPGNEHWVEPALFEALLEVSPASTALALARLCRESGPWIAAEADRLAPSNPKLRIRLQDAAAKVAARWQQIARRSLPALLGSEDPHDWLDPCKAREAELGPQVLPVGWGLDAVKTRIRLKRPQSKRP